MSRTFYARLIVTFFLLFATGRVQAEGPVRLTTPSWDNIRFGYPVNISWTELPDVGGSAILELDSTDPGNPDNWGVTLNGGVPRGTNYWIWIPRPELFGDDMSQWNSDRLWRVSLISKDEAWSPDNQPVARSPEFHIFLDNSRPTTSTAPIPTPTPTPTPTSAIPTKDPKTDHTVGRDDLSAGVMAGIVIGCLVIIVAVLIVFAILRHRRQTQERQLALFTGSTVDESDRDNKGRVNIADMIPAFPSAVPPSSAQSTFLADKNDPTPAYELQGSSIPSAGPSASPPRATEFPASTLPSIQLPGNSSPAGSPAVMTPPGSREGNSRHHNDTIAATSNNGVDWTFDPVRGSYMGPNLPIAIPERLSMGDEDPAAAPGAVLEHPIYQSIYRPSSVAGPSRKTE